MSTPPIPSPAPVFITVVDPDTGQRYRVQVARPPQNDTEVEEILQGIKGGAIAPRPSTGAVAEQIQFPTAKPFDPRRVDPLGALEESHRRVHAPAEPGGGLVKAVLDFVKGAVQPQTFGADFRAEDILTGPAFALGQPGAAAGIHGEGFEAGRQAQQERITRPLTEGVPHPNPELAAAGHTVIQPGEALANLLLGMIPILGPGLGAYREEAADPETTPARRRELSGAVVGLLGPLLAGFVGRGRSSAPDLPPEPRRAAGPGGPPPDAATAEALRAAARLPARERQLVSTGPPRLAPGSRLRALSPEEAQAAQAQVRPQVTLGPKVEGVSRREFLRRGPTTAAGVALQGPGALAGLATGAAVGSVGKRLISMVQAARTGGLIDGLPASGVNLERLFAGVIERARKLGEDIDPAILDAAGDELDRAMAKDPALDMSEMIPSRDYLRIMLKDGEDAAVDAAVRHSYSTPAFLAREAAARSAKAALGDPAAPGGTPTLTGRSIEPAAAPSAPTTPPTPATAAPSRKVGDFTMEHNPQVTPGPKVEGVSRREFLRRGPSAAAGAAVRGRPTAQAAKSANPRLERLINDLDNLDNERPTFDPPAEMGVILEEMGGAIPEEHQARLGAALNKAGFGTSTDALESARSLIQDAMPMILDRLTSGAGRGAIAAPRKVGDFTVEHNPQVTPGPKVEGVSRREFLRRGPTAAAGVATGGGLDTAGIAPLEALLSRVGVSAKDLPPASIDDVAATMARLNRARNGNVGYYDVLGDMINTMEEDVAKGRSTGYKGQTYELGKSGTKVFRELIREAEAIRSDPAIAVLRNQVFAASQRGAATSTDIGAAPGGTPTFTGRSIEPAPPTPKPAPTSTVPTPPIPTPGAAAAPRKVGDFTVEHNPQTKTFGLKGPQGEKVAGRILDDRIEMVSIGKGQAPDSRTGVAALRQLGQEEGKPVYFVSQQLSESGGRFRERMMARGELEQTPEGLRLTAEPPQPKTAAPAPEPTPAPEGVSRREFLSRAPVAAAGTIAPGGAAAGAAVAAVPAGVELLRKLVQRTEGAEGLRAKALRGEDFLGGSGFSREFMWDAEGLLDLELLGDDPHTRTYRAGRVAVDTVRTAEAGQLGDEAKALAKTLTQRAGLFREAEGIRQSGVTFKWSAPDTAGEIGSRAGISDANRTLLLESVLDLTEGRPPRRLTDLQELSYSRGPTGNIAYRVLDWTDGPARPEAGRPFARRGFSGRPPVGPGLAKDLRERAVQAAQEGALYRINRQGKAKGKIVRTPLFDKLMQQVSGKAQGVVKDRVLKELGIEPPKKRGRKKPLTSTGIEDTVPGVREAIEGARAEARAAGKRAVKSIEKTITEPTAAEAAQPSAALAVDDIVLVEGQKARIVATGPDKASVMMPDNTVRTVPLEGLQKADVTRTLPRPDVRHSGLGGPIEQAAAGLAKPVMVKVHPNLPEVPLLKSEARLRRGQRPGARLFLEKALESSIPGSGPFQRLREVQNRAMENLADAVVNRIHDQGENALIVGKRAIAAIDDAREQALNMARELYTKVDGATEAIKVPTHTLKIQAKALKTEIERAKRLLPASEFRKAEIQLNKILKAPADVTFAEMSDFRSGLLARTRAIREAVPDKGAGLVKKLVGEADSSMERAAQKAGGDALSHWREANTHYTWLKQTFNKSVVAEMAESAPELVHTWVAKAPLDEIDTIRSILPQQQWQAVKARIIRDAIEAAMQGEIDLRTGSSLAEHLKDLTFVQPGRPPQVLRFRKLQTIFEDRLGKDRMTKIYTPEEREAIQALMDTASVVHARPRDLVGAFINGYIFSEGLQIVGKVGAGRTMDASVDAVALFGKYGVMNVMGRVLARPEGASRLARYVRAVNRANSRMPEKLRFRLPPKNVTPAVASAARALAESVWAEARRLEEEADDEPSTPGPASRP